MKKIKIKDEYVTLGQLLKLSDCISTGGQAKFFLAETTIYVNDEQDQRRGRKCYPGDEVKVEGYGTFKVVLKS
jgi:ribosome-associated protein